MNYFFTYLKGIAMGAADVVPGVSGGTIAFITGIYDTLLNSIRSITPKLFVTWKQEGFQAVLKEVNAGFLIALFAGIFTSILTLAKLISWLLETHPIPLWSFFFGLIIISIIHMLKQVEKRHVSRLVTIALGFVFAYVITVAKPLDMEPTAINTILAGAIAICAMILPGISGSFILLLLGMYAPILGAVKGLELGTLGLFAIGAVTGLLCFSHLLSWLLEKYRDLTLTFLIGLMLGTLPKIWPWKETISWRTNSHGEQVPLLQNNLSPMEFHQTTGEASHVGLAVVCMLVGMLIVWGLEKVSEK